MLFFFYRVTSWCQTCGAVAKASCVASSHKCVNKYTINSGSSTTGSRSGVEILSLKSDLVKLKDLSQTKLSQAIEKTKEVKAHLDLVLKSLKSSERDVKEMYDHNSAQLAEMSSLLEEKAKKVLRVKASAEVSMPDLLALVDDSKTDDSHDTLRRKMQKSVEKCDEKLTRASQKALEVKTSVVN